MVALHCAHCGDRLRAGRHTTRPYDESYRPDVTTRWEIKRRMMRPWFRTRHGRLTQVVLTVH